MFRELVDFVIEAESGRDVRVLQLTDIQIIDPSQKRYPERIGASMDAQWESVEDNYHQYVKHVIEKTEPDLILVTGDNVYGEFDDQGTAWLELIAFMESFQIPWAPVMGNHDQESKKGADWQCEQLEKAVYCLFKQRTLTGNGNYTVGIVQNQQLIRVFFMMDSNGCILMSQESYDNGHSRRAPGFGQDQIDWYTCQIKRITAQYPNIRLTFGFHIPIDAFMDAYAQYGFNNSNTREHPISVQVDDGKAEFGYIGENLAGTWDVDRKVWNSLQEHGVDSILVGHEHGICTSLMYDGIRMQHGRKSSTYDSTSYLTEDNHIVISYEHVGEPIVGGTLMTLCEGLGTIVSVTII